MTPIILGPGDEPALERFLAAHADSSMFLRGNSRRAGLVDRGGPLEGTYAAMRHGSGEIVAVAAHYWNGNIMVQGRVDVIGDVARAAVAQTAATHPGHQVRGFHGPHALVVAARAALGLAARPAQIDAREDLFSLALADLRVPAPLADGQVVCRRPVADDAEALARFGAGYSVEALGGDDGPVTPDEIAKLRRQIIAGESPSWVLAADGAPVAMMRFTAELPDTVQIGGVYTPPALRARGYARAVVAGGLLDARARGVKRSVLFTDENNVAARRAYLALGYQIVGDYSIVHFA